MPENGTRRSAGRRHLLIVWLLVGLDCALRVFVPTQESTHMCPALIAARAISLMAIMSWGLRVLWEAVRTLMLAQHSNDLASRSEMMLRVVLRAWLRMVWPERNWRGPVHALAMLAWVAVPSPACGWF